MKVFILIAILLLSFASFGQDAPAPKTIEELKKQKKPFKHDNQYVIHYDKFEDESRVQCVGFNLIGFGENLAEVLAGGIGGRRGNVSVLMLGSGFGFKGDTLKEEPSDYYLYFYYSGEQWKFLRNTKLIALLDGETRIQFGEGEAIRNIGYGGVTEIIGFKVTKEQLLQMANAKLVEIKIGSYVKPLKKEYQEMFANIVKLGDMSQRAEVKKKK